MKFGVHLLWLCVVWTPFEAQSEQQQQRCEAVRSERIQSCGSTHLLLQGKEGLKEGKAHK